MSASGSTGALSAAGKKSITGVSGDITRFPVQNITRILDNMKFQSLLVGDDVAIHTGGIRNVVWNGDNAMSSILATVDCEDDDVLAKSIVGTMTATNFGLSPGMHCALGMLPRDRCKGGTFCPDGVLKPRTLPYSSDQGYLPFLVAVLWKYDFADFMKSKFTDRYVHGQHSSLGAVLAASHPRGHSCLSFTTDLLTDYRIAHEVNTMSGVGSLIKNLGLVSSHRFRYKIGKLKVDYGGVKSLHVIPVPDYLDDSVHSLADEVSGVALELDVMTWFPAKFSGDDFSVVDDGILPEQDMTCCKRKDSAYEYCTNCKLFVVSHGHEGRCRDPHVTESDGVMQVIRRRAQLGDTYHRADIIMVLALGGYSEKTRNQKITDYVSGTAQASYMRSIGVEGETAILSTWFECEYDVRRALYLKKTFKVDVERLPPIPLFQNIFGATSGIFSATVRPDNAPLGWEVLYSRMAVFNTSQRQIILEKSEAAAVTEAITLSGEFPELLWNQTLSPEFFLLSAGSTASQIEKAREKVRNQRVAILGKGKPSLEAEAQTRLSYLTRLYKQAKAAGRL